LNWAYIAYFCIGLLYAKFSLGFHLDQWIVGLICWALNIYMAFKNSWQIDLTFILASHELFQYIMLECQLGEGKCQLAKCKGILMPISYNFKLKTLRPINRAQQVTNAHVCVTMVQKHIFLAQLTNIWDNMDMIHIFNHQWWYRILEIFINK